MKDIANILKVLQHYQLLDTARWEKDSIIVLCPFHNDTNPSCSISLTKSLYYCRSCCKGGDIPNFIQSVEEGRGNTINPMQVLLIAEGYSTPSLQVQNTYINNIYISIENLSLSLSKKPVEEYERDSYKFYKSLPAINWDNHTDHYMVKRGFTPATLSQNGVKINKTSTNPVVIPLLEDGQFKGYVARRIDQKKDRKYINSKGLDRNNLLAGTLPTIPSPVLVCEGPLDRLAAEQLGFPHSICLLGWKASEYQLKKLTDSASSIIWATDNDAPGEQGYLDAALHIRKQYPHIPITRFPFPVGYKDICDFLQSPEAFKSIIKSLNAQE